ncbi:MAG: hypothetical protein OGM09_10080 [Fusobacterium varium]|uniref:hypothetical protein n=1 Tax=Fusobacterium varium TaxID=856 RepID=UPI00242A7905|nr:hypothetical protein [Fusobacterium varium]UYI77520.1 MAG: hypothetical protein OGM09_10080 [Fusobacterium varium]
MMDKDNIFIKPIYFILFSQTENMTIERKYKKEIIEEKKEYLLNIYIKKYGALGTKFNPIIDILGILDSYNDSMIKEVYQNKKEEYKGIYRAELVERINPFSVFKRLTIF